jgi:hypothetical protein
MIGLQLSRVLGVDSYRGVTLSKGRRFLVEEKDTIAVHVIYWIGDPETYVVRTLDGNMPIDVNKLASPEQMPETCVVMIHQGHDTQPSLQELVDRPVPAVTQQNSDVFVPRVREPFSDEVPPIPEAVLDQISEAEFHSARSEDDSFASARSSVMLASRLGVFDRRNKFENPFVKQSYLDAFAQEVVVF